MLSVVQYFDSYLPFLSYLKTLSLSLSLPLSPPNHTCRDTSGLMVWVLHSESGCLLPVRERYLDLTLAMAFDKATNVNFRLQ